MSGIANSWFTQQTTQPTPCLSGSTTSSSILSSCVLWLMVGLLIGGLRFQKKGAQQ